MKWNKSHFLLFVNFVLFHWMLIFGHDAEMIQSRTRNSVEFHGDIFCIDKVIVVQIIQRGVFWTFIQAATLFLILFFIIPILSLTSTFFLCSFSGFLGYFQVQDFFILGIWISSNCNFFWSLAHYSEMTFLLFIQRFVHFLLMMQKNLVQAQFLLFIHIDFIWIRDSTSRLSDFFITNLGN